MTTVTIKNSRQQWKKSSFQNEDELLDYLLKEGEKKIILHAVSFEDMPKQSQDDYMKMKKASEKDIGDFNE